MSVCQSLTTLFAMAKARGKYYDQMLAEEQQEADTNEEQQENSFRDVNNDHTPVAELVLVDEEQLTHTTTVEEKLNHTVMDIGATTYHTPIVDRYHSPRSRRKSENLRRELEEAAEAAGMPIVDPDLTISNSNDPVDSSGMNEALGGGDENAEIENVVFEDQQGDISATEEPAKDKNVSVNFEEHIVDVIIEKCETVEDVGADAICDDHELQIVHLLSELYENEAGRYGGDVFDCLFRRAMIPEVEREPGDPTKLSSHKTTPIWTTSVSTKEKMKVKQLEDVNSGLHDMVSRLRQELTIANNMIENLRDSNSYRVEVNRLQVLVDSSEIEKKELVEEVSKLKREVESHCTKENSLQGLVESSESEKNDLVGEMSKLKKEVELHCTKEKAFTEELDKKNKELELLATLIEQKESDLKDETQRAFEVENQAIEASDKCISLKRENDSLLNECSRLRDENVSIKNLEKVTKQNSTQLNEEINRSDCNAVGAVNNLPNFEEEMAETINALTKAISCLHQRVELNENILRPFQLQQQLQNQEQQQK